MKTLRLIIYLALFQLATNGSAQFLSRLHAVKTDALYTTYAAPLVRSHYKTDQGYQFQWTDDESGVEFISRDGPNMGIAIKCDNRLIFKLQELFAEPVVTTSYSDLVKYFYYPVKDLRVEVFFTAYSSETAILQCRFVNESHFPVSFTALPYLYFPSADSALTIEHQAISDGYTFQLQKKRDGWMVEHNIPLVEKLSGTICSSLQFDSVCTFQLHNKPGQKEAKTDPLGMLKQSITGQKRNTAFFNGIAGLRTFRLQPGESTSFRIITGKPASSGEDLMTLDLEKLVNADEQAYAKIPKLTFTDQDKEMLYWSAFSLMRQCMMPPEGECRHNYYIFSREPRWGWGYGGQVFHESLVMLAYVYMDPQGAMNSQRVFMDRQKPDGYINYRTGPYLNEIIETNGRPTSSAPWFNYTNFEIYKITGNRQFLKDAYTSGKMFYQYYVANRDSNNNGLCEWGAHAELESVRDARVAVWDQVGWAANFEGPDVNSMLVMEARSLAQMANQLGLDTESKRWQEDAFHRSALINKILWDPQTGFYYNVNKKDQSFTYSKTNDLKIKEIIGFLPLWAGVPDSMMAKSLVITLLDTTEFWRPYGVPSLTAASDYYCPIGYWNGPVWVQWEYLLYRGLLENGYKTEADQLASRVMDNMIYHLKKDHVFWEFYSADDRQAGWNKTYIWAGIAARFLLDAR
jgi:hypothetical protein